MSMLVVAIALTAMALPTSAIATERTRLTLRTSHYGTVLFANGYAMYVFTADKGPKSRCYGDCAKAWPPLKARGRIVAGDGVDPDLVAVTKRRGGRRQVTYAGQPLYGYVHDPRGEVLCQNVDSYGGTWYVVLASGQPVTFL